MTPIPWKECGNHDCPRKFDPNSDEPVRSGYYGIHGDFLFAEFQAVRRNKSSESCDACLFKELKEKYKNHPSVKK